MTAQVRPATIADAPAIAHVHVASWRTTYAGIVPQLFLDALDPGERARQWREWITFEKTNVFVAEESGSVCGFAACGPLREARDVADCEIYAIYLLAGAQGTGAGRALLNALAGALRERGWSRPLVWVLAQNPACGFYERMGAQRIAEKTIEIGGASLVELAYAWPNLRAFGVGES